MRVHLYSLLSRSRGARVYAGMYDVRVVAGGRGGASDSECFLGPGEEDREIILLVNA